MKVLIIEDVTAKAKAIASAVEEAGVAADDIQIVPDLQQARRTLSESEVSLLLLDLRIPSRYDRDPQLGGGTDLLEWIEREEGLHKPAVTVVLSAAEVSESNRRELLGRGVIFMTYEPSNTTWREFLVSFIQRLLVSSGSFTSTRRVSGDVPVVILSSTEVELFHARRVFKCDAEPLIRGGVSWYRGQAQSTVMPPVVVAKSPQMGMPAAAVLCTQALSVWRPRIVVMVGVCAGIKGEADLGDLVVADPVWDYNSGKLDAGGNMHADPRQISLNARTRTIVDSLGENSEIARVCDEWAAQRPDRISRLLRRPAASGSAVVTDPRVSTMVAAQGRKAAAIDMEAYGLYYAAENFPQTPVDFLSVKTVVDHADGGKGDGLQPFGAYLSCSFAHLFIRKWVAQSGSR